MLANLLTPGLAAFLAEAPACDRFRGPDELRTRAQTWIASGRAQAETIGHSRSGQEIDAFVFGAGDKTFLAWGYPHPDEPLGAEALCWLGDGLAAGRLPDLDGWRVVLVLCPDPDETNRQLWFDAPRNLDNFIKGAWRPTHLGWEVDYGFPLDWGPFWQPDDYEGRCRTSAECRLRCGPGGCRFRHHPTAPLQESLALAEALRRFSPDIVASMHSTHTGGDYTFLLVPETRATLDDLIALPAACGSLRHLGEPIDRGRHWRRDAPDLIQERGLVWFERQLRRHPAFLDGYVYPGNHSAGAFVQALGRGAQFVCPETGHFRHPDFANIEALNEGCEISVAIEDRPKAGRSQVVRIRVGQEWVICQQQRRPGARRAAPRLLTAETTRAMLGTIAVMRRRQTLARADRLWDKVSALPDLIDHPYLYERERLSVPGQWVNDGSLRIFRTAERYQRPASRAQAACFRWRWPIHTAAMLANFQNFLRHQDGERPDMLRARQQLDRIQEDCLRGLARSLRQESPREPALRSMLARTLRLCLARS